MTRILLLVALVAAPALAKDPRIATRFYDPSQIVTVHGHTGIQSTIEFGPDEHIDNVAVGDSADWQVTPNKHASLLFVKPMQPTAHTNMTVVTDQRTYLFDLVASPGATPVYVMRFTYPPEPKRAMPVVPTAALTPEPAPQLADKTPASTPADLNFAWTSAGAKQLLPARTFDDGKATWARLAQGQRDARDPGARAQWRGGSGQLPRAGRLRRRRRRARATRAAHRQADGDADPLAAPGGRTTPARAAAPTPARRPSPRRPRVPDHEHAPTRPAPADRRHRSASPRRAARPRARQPQRLSAGRAAGQEIGLGGAGRRGGDRITARRRDLLVDERASRRARAQARPGRARRGAADAGADRALSADAPGAAALCHTTGFGARGRRGGIAGDGDRQFAGTADAGAPDPGRSTRQDRRDQDCSRGRRQRPVRAARRRHVGCRHRRADARSRRTP